MTITLHIPAWLLWALLPVALLLLFEQIWVRYLAVMHLKQVMAARGLKPWARFFAFWVVLPIGVFLDWLGNVLASVPFLDPPRSAGELITGRLQRYVNDGSIQWRGRWAWAFAEVMLNDFDQPGGHIKKGNLAGSAGSSVVGVK